MKLFVQAIKSAPQVVVDYLNAVTIVTRYSHALTQTHIPTLVTPPAQYGDYANTFAASKIHVGAWANQVLPSVSEIPNAFFNLDNIVETQLTTVISLLQALQKEPANKQLISNIQTELQTLAKELSTADTSVTGLINVVNNYRANVKPDAAALSAICDQITAAETVDAKQIAQLKGVIQNLQNIVDDRSKLATLDIIADVAITVFLSAAGTAVGLPFATAGGAIVGTLFGIATGVASDFLPINGDIQYKQSVSDLQDEMDRVNSEIGLMNTIVGQLQSLDDAFSQLVQSSGNVEAQCGIVASYWQQSAHALTVSMGDLNQALVESSANAATIAAAITDVEAARTAWQQTLAVLKPIKDVTYTFETGLVSAQWPQ